MIQILRAMAVAVAWAIAVAGCSILGIGEGGPTSCAARYSSARCDAILVSAAQILGLDPAEVIDIQILPLPTPEVEQYPPDRRISVRLILRGGQTRETFIHCAGIAPAHDAPCMDRPRVSSWAPGGEGYRDYPEGATPVPEIDPGAAAAATGLSLPRLDIPIARPGPHRIVIGRAGLANGIIQEASMELAESWPSSVVLRGGIRMELTPLDGGPPIQNIYEHGWQAGVEQVEVAIIFDAVIVRPGAVLTVLNMVVR